MAENGFTPSHITNRLKSLSLDSDPNFRFQDELPRRNSNPTFLTLRALVTSKEAGVVIGKAGKNVNDIRELTGARAGVSKVVPGVPSRILSVSGSLDAVVKAYGIVMHSLIDSADVAVDNLVSLKTGPGTASIRILVAHSLMGTIIGRMGAKIKQIQEMSGTKMIANKDLLPQSTERVVEIQGTADAIMTALAEVARCILAEWEKAQGTILYNPVPRPTPAAPFYPNFTPQPPPTFSLPLNGDYSFRSSPRYEPRYEPRYDGGLLPHVTPSFHLPPLPPVEVPAPLLTKKLSIAADLVGCVIGKQGFKIAEIRRLSNAKISIAKEPDLDRQTRLFTLYGTPEANDTAIYLIYAQLEAEKERRAQHAQNALTRARGI